MSVGKMTCWREILQIPRMWAIVQCFFLHKKQEGSSDKCYRNKLREGGSTYLAAGQKESKLHGIASTDFHNKLYFK